MSKKSICVYLLLFVSLLAACSTDKMSEPQAQSLKDQTQSADVINVRKLLEENLNYATTENIGGYLSTISKKGHEATREAMLNFFENYDVTHTLLDFELVQEDSSEIIVKARQKSEGTTQLEEADYKDHIAEVLHVFIREQDSWKIDESSVTDIKFLD